MKAYYQGYMGKEGESLEPGGANKYISGRDPKQSRVRREVIQHDGGRHPHRFAFDHRNLFNMTYGDKAPEVEERVNKRREDVGVGPLRLDPGPWSLVPNAEVGKTKLSFRPSVSGGGFYSLGARHSFIEPGLPDSTIPFHEAVHALDHKPYSEGTPWDSSLPPGESKFPDRRPGNYKDHGRRYDDEGVPYHSYPSYSSPESVPPIIAAKRRFFITQGREAANYDELRDYMTKGIGGDAVDDPLYKEFYKGDAEKAAEYWRAEREALEEALRRNPDDQRARDLYETFDKRMRRAFDLFSHNQRNQYMNGYGAGSPA